MASELVDVLRRELDEVVVELGRVREEEEAVRADVGRRLHGLGEVATRLQARARHIRALLALEGCPVPEADVSALSAEVAPAPEKLADRVYEFLLGAGREFHYLDLAQELRAQHVQIPGADPAKNLVAHIHNDPRFLRPKRGVYGLAEWYPKTAKSVGARKRGRKRKGRRSLSSGQGIAKQSVRRGRSGNLVRQ